VSYFPRATVESVHDVSAKYQLTAPGAFARWSTSLPQISMQGAHFEIAGHHLSEAQPSRASSSSAPLTPRDRTQAVDELMNKR